ncbi:probable 28S ribosomal protein S23, mitochondrial [Photinus pyralis]|uniref:Small ribosomal subunit protein mS23 n=1 Tax=Photinus pyralis TaxID=7054 RepID=A0A1Y1LFJ9_PHOPY|nr:probable 28S ribosomal protein S23, mitochondrial [Photinus pyralis]
MARSRLEKIGTIYSRTKGLLQSTAIHWDDRPLWYDLYEAFPPLEEPRFDRPAPNITLKKIFYEEDKIRALLHNRNKFVGTTNMFNNKSQTLTRRFIETYKRLDEQYNGSASEDVLYSETIQFLKQERNKPEESEPVSLVQSFTDAERSSNVGVKVSDLFKN